MKIDELIKKPIEVIVENNISEDMIFPGTSKTEFLDRILNKLSNDLESFLFVYVNDNKERRVRAVITAENLTRLIDILGANSNSKIVEELNLEVDFAPRFEVEVSEPISTILNIFNTETTDLVIVKSRDGQYLGKVRKTKLREWFTIMVS